MRPTVNANHYITPPTKQLNMTKLNVNSVDCYKVVYKVVYDKLRQAVVILLT